MSEIGQISKQGILRKRSARIHSWNSRYFMLSGSKLSYKLREDTNTTRDTFDLVSGCIVTEIQEESKGSKRLFSFWVIWPEEANKNGGVPQSASLEEDSDDENENDEEGNRIGQSKGRNLKQIVESEVQTHRKNRSTAEGIVEQYHARDHNYNIGMKVAAFAVGGVLVGALTAGIGLVPYITVVGITAAAGGGAVALNWRKPIDSRLILACESMEEAIEWKVAIGQQILKLEDNQKPVVPSIIDTNKISSLINRKIPDQSWYTVSFHEGIRILEHVTTPLIFRRKFLAQATSLCRIIREIWWKKPVNFMFPLHLVENENTTIAPENGQISDGGNVYCRRSNTIVNCMPINCFLFLMNSKCWPKFGEVRTVKEVDDHADIIGIELRYDDEYFNSISPEMKKFKNRLTARRIALSRFWSLDEEGVYIITLNSLFCEEYPPAIKRCGDADFIHSPKPVSNDSAKSSAGIDVVISISPRKDSADYEYDIAESLVSITVQVTVNSNGFDWGGASLNNEASSKSRVEEELLELRCFQNEFLKNHIQELQYALLCSKYHMDYSLDGILTGGLSASNTTTTEIAASSNILSTINTSGKAPPLLLPSNKSPNKTRDEPPSPKSSISTGMNSNRRGVTTVQPGMDDVSVDCSRGSMSQALEYDPRGSATKINSTVSTSNQPTKRSMLGFFRSKSSTSASATPPKFDGESSPPSTPPSTQNRKTNVANNLSSSTAVVTANISKKPSNEPMRKHVVGSQKQKRTNSEASKLRSQIAATEYEIQRLAKAIRRKVILPTASNVNGNTTTVTHLMQDGSLTTVKESQELASEDVLKKQAVTPTEYSLLQDTLRTQQEKLQQLRQQHVQLTGLTYEQAKRSLLSKFRWFRRGDDRKSVLNTATSSTIDTSTATTFSGADNNNGLVRKVQPRPIHWISYTRRPNRDISWLLRREFWTGVWNILRGNTTENDPISNRCFAVAQVTVLFFVVVVVIMSILMAHNKSAVGLVLFLVKEVRRAYVLTLPLLPDQISGFFEN